MSGVTLASPAQAAALGTTVTTRTTSVGADAQLQYCGNGRVEDTNPTVTTVVVVIHGTGRDACNYASNTVKAAAAGGVTSSTLVVAPHFLADSDSHSGRLYWSSSGWKEGDKSRDSSQISSFAVVDRLLANATKTRYPNLRRVVVAGHSAGGQFVNRYSAGTATTSVTRYVVANPSSYLYFGTTRVTGTTLRELTSAEKSACTSFNDYKYGVGNRNTYMNAASVDTLRSRFASRPTTLLLGTADTVADDDLDTTCAANWQGPNRYVRGHQYHDIYLPAELGPAALKTQQQVDVPNVGHSWAQMSRSTQGLAALFG